MYKRFDAGRREERGSGPCRQQGPLKGHVSEVFLDAVGGQGGIGADGDGELNIVLLGEAVQPVQELLHRMVGGLGGHNLGQAVDKDMGDVVVARVQAADKALQEVIALNIVMAGLHQTDLIMNVIGQLGAPLDADHIAVLAVDSGINELDHLLGLAGALDTHDHSHHSYHSFIVRRSVSPALCNYVTIFAARLQLICGSSPKINGGSYRRASSSALRSS